MRSQADRILGTKRQRKIASIGCASSLLLLVVVVIIVGVASPDAHQPQGPAVAARSHVRVDDRQLPILNMEVKFPGKVLGGSMIQVAAAMRNLGHQVERGQNPSWKAATAANVAVINGEGAWALHFTVPVAPLRQLAIEDRQSGAFLNLAREIGFNSIEGERAAREYCGVASAGFCSQVP